MVAVTVSIFGSGAASGNGDLGTFVFADNTVAYIGAGAVVDSEGNVLVSAADDSLLISVVAVGNGSGGAAMIGVANVNTISSQTKAYIATGATVNARGNGAGISVYSGELGSPSALPSGNWDRYQSGLDLNGDGENDVQPVNKNLDMDRDGNPDGSVDGDIDFTVHGKNIQEDGTGLGVKLTETVHGLAVVAVSNQKIISTTIAIAGAGGVGATGATAVNVLTATTEAFIGDGAVINSSVDGASGEQTVLVKAASNALVVMTAGTFGGGGLVGASGSFNIGIISNVTKAHAGGTIQAVQDIEIRAFSNEDLQVHTINGSFGGLAGTGAAVSVGIVDGETLAYVHKNADLAAYRDIVIHAANNALVIIDAIGADVGGAGGLSGALAIGLVTHTTRAYVESAASFVEAASLYTARDLEVKAESLVDLTGAAVSAAGGGGVGVAGAIIAKIIATTTEAYLGDWAFVNNSEPIDSPMPNQTVRVWAVDTIKSRGAGGSQSVGGLAGVGAAADVTLIRNSVQAYIGQNAFVIAKRHNYAGTPAGNVEVLAESHKQADSVVIAASGGGASGIGGSTAIIAIGSVLNSDSRTSLGQALNYIKDVLSRDLVTGKMGNSSHVQDTENGLSAIVTGLGNKVYGFLNDLASDSLSQTRAYIGAEANVNADNDITVSAEDYTAVNILAGGDGVGAVGAGGGIGIATIFTATEAFAETGAQLRANHNITVQALVKNQEKNGSPLALNVAAFGGSAGLVGLGAAVAYLDVENIVRAKLDGTKVREADKLLLLAMVANNLRADALGAALGSGAAGASLARAKHTGTMEAVLGNNSLTDNVGDLEVKAIWQTTADATARAGAAGIGAALNGAVALTQVDPTIKAYIGDNTNIETTGDILILAQSLVDSSTQALGVSLAAGYSVGVSSAKTVIQPKNKAYIGSGTVNAGGSITLQALHNMNTYGAIVANSAQADATAPAGGLYGVIGAKAEANSSANVEAYLASAAQLTAGRNISLQSLNYNKAEAEAKGVTGGAFAAVGATQANAFSGGVTKSYINGRIINAGALQLLAQGYALSAADSRTAAGGGLASGSSSTATALSSPVVASYLGYEAQVKVSKFTGTTGDVVLQAQSIANAIANAYGANAGGATVGQSLAEATVAPEVAAYFAEKVAVDAANDIIVIAAHNYNLDGSQRSERAYAFANASSGSLAGQNGAIVLAKQVTDVKTYIDNNSVVSAGRDITLQAYGRLDAQAEGNGNSAGVIGIGTVVVRAQADGTVLAYLAPGTITAGRDLLVSALGRATPDASSQQAAGGIVSGGGSTAESISSLIVRVFLGRNPVSGLPGGSYSAQAGTISGLARAEGGSTAVANGINASGITVGLSSAKAVWEAASELTVGRNAVLTAGRDLYLQAEQDDTSSSYASSSTGSLVGAAGSKAETETNSSAVVYLEEASNLTAGRDADIFTTSESINDAEASGKAFGLEASGTTVVKNTLSNTARTRTGAGTQVQAGRNLSFTSLALSNARKAKAEGGAGGILTDGVSTKATTILNHNSEAILGGNALFTAGNDNIIQAHSRLDAHGWAQIKTAGAVTENRTETQVTVNAVTQIILSGGVEVSGRYTYILAQVTHLQADSYAESVTYAAYSTSDAAAVLNINSLAQVLVQGATAEALNDLEIRATHADVATNSHAHGEIGGGVTGTINSTASNNLVMYAKLDIQAGSVLHAADIWLEAFSPQEVNEITGIYQRDAVAESDTLVQYVEKWVDELYYETITVVEKVTEWLPWPLGEVVKWVTKTIVQPVYRSVKRVVAEIVGSDVTTNTLGNYVNESQINLELIPVLLGPLLFLGNYVNESQINLEGDVYLGNARGIKLIIDENGQISSEGGVTAQIIGSQIVVNDFVNDQLGHLTINAPFGELTGNAVIHKNTVVGLFEIINHSSLDLKINNIILVNNNAGKEQDVAIYVLNKDGLDLTGFTVGISKTPQVSIVSTKADADIIIDGVMENPTGIINIVAGGSIYSSSGSAIQANNLELKAGAQIGRDADHRLLVQMYKQAFFENPVFSLTASGDAYLEVLLRENTKPGDPPPPGMINRLHIARIETGGLLDFYAPQAQLNMSDYDGAYGVGEIISPEVRINLVSGYLWDDGDPGKPNINADKAVINAELHIGYLSVNKPLRTRVNYLEAHSENGHIYIRDNGQLTIGGISSQNGVYARQSVNIEAESLIVAEDIVVLYGDYIFLRAGYLKVEEDARIRNTVGTSISLCTANSGGTIEIHGYIDFSQHWQLYLVGGDGDDIFRLYSDMYKRIEPFFIIDGGGGQDTVETYCHKSGYIPVEISEDRIYYSYYELFVPKNLERVEIHGSGGKVEILIRDNNTILNDNPNIEYAFHGSNGEDTITLYYSGYSSALSLGVYSNKLTGLEGIIAKSLEFTSVEVLEFLFGSGNDTLTVYEIAPGVQIKVSGGLGSNTLDLSSFPTAVDVQLTGLGGQSGFNGRSSDASISFTNISFLYGSSAAGDSMTGMDGVSVFRLGNGVSAFSTGGEYSSGGRTLTFDGFEVLAGGSAADTFEILGNAEFSLLNGGDGNDIFNITTGSVYFGDLDGGADNDSFTFSDGSYVSGNIAGGSGDDVFTFQGNSELLGDIDGGPGSNSLDYSTAARNLKFVLTEVGASTGLNGTIAVRTIFEEQVLDLELGAFRNITALRVNPATAASLTGLDAGGTFTFDNSGDSYSSGGRTLDFDGITILLGGSGDDSFMIQRNIAYTLLGGLGDDIYRLADGISLAGLLDGQEGNDTLDFSTLTSVIDVILTALGSADGFDGLATPLLNGFRNINGIVGSSAFAENSLTGLDADAVFRLGLASDLTAGEYESGGRLLTFSGFATLNGGSGDDTFEILGDSSISHLYGRLGDDTYRFADGASYNGLLDGQEGSNTLDFSAYSTVVNVTLTGLGSAGGFDGLATPLLNGFSNISRILGGSAAGDSLTGLDAEAVFRLGIAFDLSAGEYESGGRTLSFSCFETLRGGSGDDNFEILGDASFSYLYGGAGDDLFRFADGASLNGVLDGQEGNNILDFSAYTAAINVALTGCGSLTGFDGQANVLPDGFRNISVIVGGSAAGDSLTGLDGTAVFRLGLVSDLTAGEYESGGRTLSFSSFEALNGGSRDDTFEILGDASFNLYGGAGDDSFSLKNGCALAGNIDGGLGSNTLDYSDYLTDVLVDLARRTATNVTGGISNIQNVIGGQGNDVLLGDDQDNTLDGGPGNDVLRTGAGFNILIGGEGEDRAYVAYNGKYLVPNNDIEIWSYESSEDSSPPVPPALSSQIDSSTGGTITYEGVILEILPDVLPGNTIITIQKLPTQENLDIIPQGLALVLGSDIYQITTNGPRYFGEGNFIQIKIPYDPAKIAPDERPVMYYYDEGQGIWVEIATETEYDENTSTWYAVARVNHLSKFAVFGVKSRQITLLIGQQAASVNGNTYLLDAIPYLDPQTGRTMGLLRFIGEALGAKVEWNPDLRQVQVSYNGKTLLLTLGSTTVLVNGQAATMDCVPVSLPPGRTFVPLRFIAEILGAKVEYDATAEGIRIVR